MRRPWRKSLRAQAGGLKPSGSMISRRTNSWIDRPDSRCTISATRMVAELE